MAAQIDPSTMFLALVASTLAAMLVLLWGFWLNRREKSLLWTALAFLLSATATFLLAGRGSLPDWLSIAGGGGLLLLGVGLLSNAARTFEGKPASIGMALAGPTLWLAFCTMPAIFANPDVRVVVLSTLAAALYLAAARAFSGRDGLLTRFPISVILTIHAIVVLLRVPLTLSDGVTGLVGTSAYWFGPATLEAMIFIQVAAFLMVALSKERVESKLIGAALTDQLTGLGNRRAFFERAESAIAQAVRNRSPLAVVVFDLDRFKEINDRHGHPIGDLVIQAFARAASKRLRGGDVIARVGGEEFAALLPGADGDLAAMVALQVNQAFEAAVEELGHAELTGSASAGVAHLSPALPTIETLLSAADHALYEAKAMGRGQVRRSIIGAIDVRAA